MKKNKRIVNILGLILLISIISISIMTTDYNKHEKSTIDYEDSDDYLYDDNEETTDYDLEVTQIEYNSAFDKLNDNCVELYKIQEYSKIIMEIEKFKENYPEYDYYLSRYKKWLIDDNCDDGNGINIQNIINVRTSNNIEISKSNLLTFDEWEIYPTNILEGQEFWCEVSQNLVNELFGGESNYKMAYAFKEKLIAPYPQIGMTTFEVRNSKMGNPKKINKTNTKYSKKEQWVYPNNKYIYFEDGIVTSISE